MRRWTFYFYFFIPVFCKPFRDAWSQDLFGIVRDSPILPFICICGMCSCKHTCAHEYMFLLNLITRRPPPKQLFDILLNGNWCNVNTHLDVAGSYWCVMRLKAAPALVVRWLWSRRLSMERGILLHVQNVFTVKRIMARRSKYENCLYCSQSDCHTHTFIFVLLIWGRT